MPWMSSGRSPSELKATGWVCGSVINHKLSGGAQKRYHGLEKRPRKRYKAAEDSGPQVRTCHPKFPYPFRTHTQSRVISLTVRRTVLASPFAGAQRFSLKSDVSRLCIDGG